MVDDMWLYAGDTTDTTDLNYYSKRAILTGVYGATEIFMLQDQSQDYQSTLAFLDRRPVRFCGLRLLLGLVLRRRRGDVAGSARCGLFGAVQVNLGGHFGFG